MRCVICKQGETQPGKATVTLQRQAVILVTKGVPARVCQNCGEEYLDQEITSRLFKTAEDAARSRVEVDIREFIAA